jgi:hypothetical protein
MGNYNPNKPEILGNEWVPIREENLEFSQVTNNIELGHTFMPDATLGTGFVNGRFYLNELPTALVRNQAWTMAMYNRGEEDQSGPIRRVLIPVNNGGITGSSAAIVFRNCADVATALYDASDRRYVEMQLGNSNTIDMSMYFAVNQYQQLLSGKRILGVNLLYSGEAFPDPLDDGGQLMSLEFTLRNNTGAEAIEYPPLISGNTPSTTSMSPFVSKQRTRIAIGDTNMFFNPTTGINVLEGFPWTFDSLRRFEFSDPNAIQMHLNSIGGAGDGPHWSFDWAAMEVIFCEEKRLGMGTAIFQYGAAGTTLNYRLGYNTVNLYNPQGTAVIGLNGDQEYTLTLAQASLGDSPLVFSVPRIGPQPKVNALRQLYKVEPQAGIQVNIPAPPTEDVVGRTLTVEETPVLVQLSLINTATSLVVPEPHAYGRQSVAQVYGAKIAQQRIDDSLMPANAYPQVKFWARRFGDTIIPLTLTGPASETAFITPAQFDDLAPVIDGWKEIVLQVTPAPVMGSTGDPTWTWSATGETSGNRWELLGAVAPTQNSSAGDWSSGLASLGPATYGTPTSGAQIYETWMPQSLPPVSGSTLDQTADVSVYFSWNPPAITGMTVVTANQALSGIGYNCGVPPQFIPTALQYNRVTWTPNPQYYFNDVFGRTSVNSWGTSTSGTTYVTPGTQFQVVPGFGSITPSATGIGVVAKQFVPLNNFNTRDAVGYLEISSNTTAAASTHWGGPQIRTSGTTGSTGLSLQVMFQVGGTVAIGIATQLSGGFVQQSISTQLSSYVLGTKVKLRWQAIGGTVYAKIWYDGTAEPDDWQFNYVYQIASMTYGGLSFQAARGTGAAPAVTLTFSNILVSAAENQYIELQRRDSVTDWQTIMKATNMATSGFNDYEARIDLLSEYRIRNVNVYGFVGPWSTVVGNTIPAPGVTATGLSANDHVYVYTTNEVQNGSSNLAYSPAWEGTVVEDFNFPESAGQVIQAMYNRDYVTVFRPTERGGTNFSRTMLVQAAAISPETLEDFTSLRNMAWANVSYIAVRDEEGNRWYANVSVPSGTVVHGRRLYMAPVNIIEVTATPTQVNP